MLGEPNRYGREVPFEARGWRYDAAEGEFLMCDDEIEVTRRDPGTAYERVDIKNTGTVRTKGDPMVGSARFTYAEVRACYEASLKESKPIKDVFAKMYAAKCTPEFLARCALGAAKQITG